MPQASRRGRVADMSVRPADRLRKLSPTRFAQPFLVSNETFKRRRAILVLHQCPAPQRLGAQVPAGNEWLRRVCQKCGMAALPRLPVKCGGTTSRSWARTTRCIAALMAICTPCFSLAMAPSAGTI